MAQSQKTPEVLVLDPQFEPIENYPSTPAIAQKNFQEYLAQKLIEGWKYAGQISQVVGAEKDRKYWVFYRLQ
jgi:hypothetical protein